MQIALRTLICTMRASNSQETYFGHAARHSRHCKMSHYPLTFDGISMSAHRTHIVIPEPLVTEIDQLVGKRGRSQFLTQAAERELRRLRQIRALENIAGAWKDGDHPELRGGAASWVRGIRKESYRRLRRETTGR
jgi:hypothetical protein